MGMNMKEGTGTSPAAPIVISEDDSMLPVSSSFVVSGQQQEAAATTAAAIESMFVPSDLELTLLCWDFLRHNRQQQQQQQTGVAMTLADQYKTLASWALYQSLLHIDDEEDDDDSLQQRQQEQQQQLDTSALPSLAGMEHCLARYHATYSTPPPPLNHHNNNSDETKESKEPDESNDNDQTNHNSTYNSNDEQLLEDDVVWTPHRFFTDGGLAPTPNVPLGQVVTAGLLLLQAKSRRAAEQEFVSTPLFAHFVAAVHAKGFFDEANTDGVHATTTTATTIDTTRFHDRFRKVVTKFRHKLNHHHYTPPPPLLTHTNCTTTMTDGSWMSAATTILDSYQDSATKAYHLHKQQQERSGGGTASVVYTQPPPPELVIAGLTVPSEYLLQRTTGSQRPVVDNAMDESGLLPSHMLPSPSMMAAVSSRPTNINNQQHPDDLTEAEACKHTGNTHMQRQEYQLAWDSYTAALLRSPSGPQSHVYFANRAAAAVSLQHWSDAVADAERSLALQPDYAKAHARLGLAHFLLGQYRYAVQAYTAALKYEPDNASSRHYLQKAAQRLAAEEQQHQYNQQHNQTTIGTTNSNSSAVQPPPMSSSFGDTADGGGVRQIPSNSSWSSRAGDSIEKTKLTSEEKEAEKFKSQGNALMSQRDYTGALGAYTKALTVSPAGGQSHVYYANRAAAYCYLERYLDARDDAVAALKLQPTYGKAHARLGLALFCAKDYAGAVEAYETALQYDPSNTAAQSYLHKAQAKVAKASQSKRHGVTVPSRSHVKQEH